MQQAEVLALVLVLVPQADPVLSQPVARHHLQVDTVQLLPHRPRQHTQVDK